MDQESHLRSSQLNTFNKISLDTSKCSGLLLLRNVESKPQALVNCMLFNKPQAAFKAAFASEHSGLRFIFKNLRSMNVMHIKVGGESHFPGNGGTYDSCGSTDHEDHGPKSQIPPCGNHYENRCCFAACSSTRISIQYEFL